MLYIETDSIDAAFHFSLEEYIIMQYPWGEPVMMIWQADKCAMVGSNQIAEAEVNLSRAELEGVKIVRRSSGGGTIYTDLGTLLFTVIQPKPAESDSFEVAKKTVTEPIIDVLNKLGVPAMLKGRNDIVVDGKKISGLAQYVRCGRMCTHGSLLFDTDLEMLAQIISPDDEKIRSKALRSVRSRVTNIKESLNYRYSTQEFWNTLKRELFLRQSICEQTLSADDYAQTEQIYQKKYCNDLWTYGQSPKFSFHNNKRFSGGNIEVFLNVENGMVSSCAIRGDFLGVVPIQGLESLLEGKLFSRQVFAEAISEISLQKYLGNVTGSELLSCFFDH